MPVTTAIRSLDEIEVAPDFAEKLQVRDPDLCWEIIQASLPLIGRFAHHFFDPEERNEVTAFLTDKLFTYLPTYKPSPTFPLKAWIAGFLEHEAIGYLRKVEQKAKYEVPLEDEEILPQDVEEEKIILKRVLLDEVRDIVKSQLGDELVYIFNLVIDQGMKVREAWRRYCKDYPPISWGSFWIKWKKLMDFIRPLVRDLK